MMLQAQSVQRGRHAEFSRSVRPPGKDFPVWVATSWGVPCPDGHPD